MDEREEGTESIERTVGEPEFRHVSLYERCLRDVFSGEAYLLGGKIDTDYFERFGQLFRYGNARPTAGIEYPSVVGKSLR